MSKQKMRTFYFWVKETPEHDRELDIIEAKNLKQAKKEFSERHPEDIENIEGITEDDNIINLL